MREIWANYLLPKVLKSCPKSNKSPNLVTLIIRTFGVKACSDVLHKTHQPGLFFTHAKNAAC